MMKTQPLLALGLSTLFVGAAVVAPAQVGQDADVSVDGRRLTFSTNARPYYSGDMLMLPVREFGDRIGASVDERRDEVRIRYRGDEAYYRKFRRDYELNGKRQGLSQAAQERRSTLFVPYVIFRDLTKRDIDARRVDFGNDWRPIQNLDVRYGGERLRFSERERPRLVRGIVYVPLRPVARQTDVDVRSERRDEVLRLRWRGSDLFYEVGRDEFEFEGRRQRLPGPSVEVDRILFVPQQMFQTLLGNRFQVVGSGQGGWDDRPGWGDEREVEIYIGNRRLDFGRNEQPFTRAGVTYVPIRAFADRLRLDVDRRGDRYRLTRGREEVEYREGETSFELNGRRQNLRRGSVEVRDVVFVPVDLFSVFADGRIEIRRR